MRLTSASVCLLAAGLAAAPASAQSPAFDKAVAQLKARLVKEGGSGLVLMAERTSVFDVTFRVQAVGATFESLQVRPRNEMHAPIFSYAGKPTDTVEGSGRLNEEPDALFVEVSGPGLSSKVTVKLPRRGEKPEVATVYIGEKKGAAE